MLRRPPGAVSKRRGRRPIVQQALVAPILPVLERVLPLGEEAELPPVPTRPAPHDAETRPHISPHGQGVGAALEAVRLRCLADSLNRTSQATAAKAELLARFHADKHQVWNVSNPTKRKRDEEEAEPIPSAASLHGVLPPAEPSAKRPAITPLPGRAPNLIDHGSRALVQGMAHMLTTQHITGAGAAAAGRVCVRRPPPPPPPLFTLHPSSSYSHQWLLFRRSTSRAPRRMPRANIAGTWREIPQRLPADWILVAGSGRSLRIILP
jgi:hypothetical protein